MNLSLKYTLEAAWTLRSTLCPLLPHCPWGWGQALQNVTTALFTSVHRSCQVSAQLAKGPRRQTSSAARP